MTDEHKPKLRILDFRYNSIDFRGQPSTLPGREEDGDITAYYTIPCGHCLGCRQDQANEWTNRLILESKYHDSTLFMTLTYSNENLVPVAFTDEETGEFHGGFTLSKRDVQLFFKRLRKAHPDDHIRYYIAGEYGPHTGRPHYHAIVFGLHLDDMVPFGASETGNQYFVSEDLQNVWSKGFVSVEPANEFTIRYVTGYVTKKLGVYPNEKFEKEGLTPPFALSSRRPGIGYQYFEDNATKLLLRDHIVLGTQQGTLQCNVPRYYRKKFKDFGFEEEMTERTLKKCRNYEAALDSLSDKTDLNEIEQLKVKEYVHTKRVSERSKL